MLSHKKIPDKYCKFKVLKLFYGFKKQNRFTN